MGGVVTDGVPEFLHYKYRAEVGNQHVVAEARAALREYYIFVSGVRYFIDYVSIPPVAFHLNNPKKNARSIARKVIFKYFFLFSLLNVSGIPVLKWPVLC